MSDSDKDVPFSNKNGLQIYFVLKDGLDSIEDISEDMNIAYTNIQEYFHRKKNTKWINEIECMNLKSESLTKQDIFIFEEFGGKAFEYIQTTKSTIIGPICLTTCLLNDLSIPRGNFPIFTTAMRNLIISSSGLTPTEKKEVKKYVSWMGGIYCDDLPAACTHLVSNTVKSLKYEQAVLNNISVMHPDWIPDVWEKSQQKNISATSKEFQKHKLPIFYNLHITTTGLTVKKRNEIKKLVLENGGQYEGGFQSKITNILIIEETNINSRKYKAAMEFKTDCLLPTWIIDSVEKGYAVPLNSYRVKKVMTISTPTKTDVGTSSADFNPNSTELSEISHSTNLKSTLNINETHRSTINPEKTKPSTSKSLYQDILNSINFDDVKKAGPFLDGYRIYLLGFTPNEKDKINKILNLAGAIRYEEMNENVTHVIIGESTKQIDSKIINEQTRIMSIITLQWLTESLKLCQPANENNFLFKTVQNPSEKLLSASPSTKKNIQSMNHSFRKPANIPKLNLELEKNLDPDCFILEDEDEIDLLNQYKNANLLLNSSKVEPKICDKVTPVASTSKSQNETNTTYTEGNTQYDFFEDLAIYVHEPDDEDLRKHIIEHCEKCGGKVVSNIYKSIVDYVIVSSEKTTDLKSLPVKGKNIVNTLWLEDAMYNNKLIEQQYFHKLIPINADKMPLKGITIVISTYAENEKVFLQSLIVLLGAKLDETYAKKEYPLLICPSPEGNKYNAAIKWKYPVVKAEWLVECARVGEYIDLHPYLTGEAKVNETWKIFASNEMEQTLGKLTDISAEKTLRQENIKYNEAEPSSSSSINKEKGAGEENNKSNKSESSSSSSSTPINKEKGAGEGNIEDDEESCEANDISIPKDQHKYTTPISHRRLSQLRKEYSCKSISPLSSAASPEIQNVLSTSNLVKQFSSPTRECILNVLKERENTETPLTQRVRKLIATPGKETSSTPKIPEFCTTPEIRKRKFEQLDRLYMPKRERRLSTPLSEVKRKFWKDIFGDQPDPDINCDEAGASTSSSFNIPLIENPERKQKNDESFQRLSDFIKNREIEERKHTHNDDDIEITNLMKIDSEAADNDKLVGWKDPSEFISKRYSSNRSCHQGVPTFSISSSKDIKQQIIKKIISLNGRVCENVTDYDETCTHLLCEIPNRGEKVLCCIAAGKWILSLKYIEDSEKAGFFINEEEYEWGNPKASCLPQIGRIEQSIANASFRWRTKLMNSIEKPIGVFNNFRVLLLVPKREQVQRLILAGGGSVLNIKPPYSGKQEAMKATHCLVERKNFSLAQSDIEAFKKAGVLVLDCMYLSAYLTSNVEPDYSNYLLTP